MRHGEPNTSIRVGFRLHERVRIMVDAPPVTTLLAGDTSKVFCLPLGVPLSLNCRTCSSCVRRCQRRGQIIAT